MLQSLQVGEPHSSQSKHRSEQTNAQDSTNKPSSAKLNPGVVFWSSSARKQTLENSSIPAAPQTPPPTTLLRPSLDCSMINIPCAPAHGLPSRQPNWRESHKAHHSRRREAPCSALEALTRAGLLNIYVPAQRSRTHGGHGALEKRSHPQRSHS